MNSTTFWRLAWKEYRTQRSLWLAVLILTVLVQTCVAVVAAVSYRTNVHGGAYLAMVFVAVGVYFLGCGATLFSLEHEQGTFDFQRSLPVSIGPVFLAKVGSGAVGGIALLAVLQLLTHAVFAGWTVHLNRNEWLAGVISVAEVFAWSICFSLILRHPLWAAVSGILAFAVVQGILLPVFFGRSQQDMTFYLYRSVLAARTGFLVLLIAVDIWLAWRWFAGRLGWPTWMSRRGKQTDVGWWVPTSIPAAPPGARQIGWRQLLAISWRQGGWVLLLGCGLYVWGLISALAQTEPNQEKFATLLAGVLVFGPATFFGLCAFSLDQWSHRFRFYAERGVDPQWLWWSRHAVWLPPVLVMGVCVSLMASPFWGDQALTQWTGWILLCLVAYSMAQLCGMLIHSTLVALVVSLLTTVLGAAWSAITVAAGIPAWWSVIPIPVVALAATWWVCRDWIEERRGWRYWMQLSMLLGLPAVVILAGCAWYRAYEFPLVDPGVSVAELTRPLTAEEQATLRLYQQVDEIGVRNRYLKSSFADPQGSETDFEEWSTAARPALELLEQAHRRPAVPLTYFMSGDQIGDDSWGKSTWYPQVSVLLLRRQAEILTQRGQLSEAWHYFDMAFELLRRVRLRPTDTVLRWANGVETNLLESMVGWGAHRGQTKENIAVAIARLNGLDPVAADLDRAVQVQHVVWARYLDGESVDAAILGLTREEAAALQWWAPIAPWELTRARRALNISTRYLRDQIAATGGVRPFLPSMELRSIFLPPMVSTYGMPELASRRQATRILLALVDWRREHGELPESIALLVGPYFPELPVDPVTNVSFDYDRVGLSEGLDPDLPANTPFLAIPTPNYPHQSDRNERLRHSTIWPVPGG